MGFRVGAIECLLGTLVNRSGVELLSCRLCPSMFLPRAPNECLRSKPARPEDCRDLGGSISPEGPEEVGVRTKAVSSCTRVGVLVGVTSTWRKADPCKGPRVLVRPTGPTSVSRVVRGSGPGPTRSQLRETPQWSINFMSLLTIAPSELRWAASRRQPLSQTPLMAQLRHTATPSPNFGMPSR